jgi:prepilin-type N-terminal cleavage/methylation domain-containing protein
MKRPERGFTLLEVMASVAIIAIVFTTLAQVASHGLRSEGQSKRRLEASLIADTVLTAIETQLASGIAPEIGETESEEGLFRILTTVDAFDLASAIPLEGLGVDDPTSDPTLAGVLGDDVSPIREIRIAVRWDEGVDEFQVIRTTYGIDLTMLEGLGDPTNPGDDGRARPTAPTPPARPGVPSS